MSEAMVLEDTIGADWWRRLDMLANVDAAFDPYRELIPQGVVSTNVQVQREKSGILHLRAAWPVRQAVVYPVLFGAWPMVAWWIGEGKVSAAMVDAAVAYALAFGVDPVYAYIKEIPAKATEFVEVHGITLIQMDWVPAGFLALVRDGNIIGRVPSYRLVDSQPVKAQARLL